MNLEKNSLRGILVDILKANASGKFNAWDISGLIVERHPEFCEKKRQRASKTMNEHDLRSQLAAEISSAFFALRDKDALFQTLEERPRKYFYAQDSVNMPVAVSEAHKAVALQQLAQNPTPKNTALAEKDLYPLLGQYLWSEHNIYSKRIDEKCAQNNRGLGGNKWLYPDMVGMEDISRDWGDEVIKCVTQYSIQKTRLWSFEVKKALNLSNVREAFFQAVSNSSWANFGYLVASQIQGPDTAQELRMLTGRHGIGVILLNTQNPAESQILIPAHEHGDIDWNIVNRVAHVNPDFMEYVKLVRQFYQTGEVAKIGWYKFYI